MVPEPVIERTRRSKVESPVALANTPDRGPVHCEIVNDMEGFDALRDAWQRLEGMDPHCTPFNTWDWLNVWWKCYAGNDELRLLVFRSGDQIVAIAPLYVRLEKALALMLIRVVRWLGSGGDTSPDYLGMVSDPDFFEAALERLIDTLFELPNWHKLHLAEMRRPSAQDDAFLQAMSRIRGAMLPGVENRLMCAPLPPDWSSYRLGLSRKRRKQINHRQNRLDRAGNSSLSICRDEDSLSEASDALVTLHRERWHSKGEPGGFASEAYESFHREIIKRFFERDQLWLVTLKLDGMIIGVQYIFAWREQLLFFQSGYSPRHESLSPGHVMFTWVIAQGIKRGMKRIDLLKGDYAYKSVYARDESFTGTRLFVRRGPFELIARCRLLAKRGLRKHRKKTTSGNH